jgi:hypothetical protein
LDESALSVHVYTSIAVPNLPFPRQRMAVWDRCMCPKEGR